MDSSKLIVSFIAFSLIVVCCVAGPPGPADECCSDRFSVVIEALPKNSHMNNRTINQRTDYSLNLDRALCASIFVQKNKGDEDLGNVKVYFQINNAWDFVDLTGLPKDTVRNILTCEPKITIQQVLVEVKKGPGGGGGKENITCLENAVINTGLENCDFTDASLTHGLMYSAPSNNSIINVQSTSEGVSWTYSNSWDPEHSMNLCRCRTWAVAYSKSNSDVWGADDRIDLQDVPCPALTISNSFSLTRSDVSESVPDGTWFWFSAKEIGNSTKDVSTSLPPLHLCYRHGKSYPPTITPSVVYFFDEKANVTVTWDENVFNTSRCGEQQPVNLWFQHEHHNSVQPENITRGHTVELVNEWPHKYYFVIQMGTDNTENKTLVEGYDCRYLKENFNVAKTTDSDTLWKRMVDFSWEGNCSDLIGNSWYEVIFSAKKHDNGQNGNSRDSIKNSTQYHNGNAVDLPYEFTAVINNFDDFGSYYVDGSLIVNMYYRGTNTPISTYEENHVFCSVTPPSFSANKISISGDAICEGSGYTSFVLNVPDIDYGRTCDTKLKTIAALSENERVINNYTDVYRQWSVTVACPEGDLEKEYQYKLHASNEHSWNDVISDKLLICNNHNPKGPRDLRVDSKDCNNSIAVVLEDSVVLSWRSDDWGNCKNYGSMTKGFEVYVDNVKVEELKGNELLHTLKVVFGGSTRKTMKWNVTAVRDGSHYGVSRTFNFTACKKAVPGVPTLVRIEEMLGERITNKTFEWHPPTYEGEDCKEPSQNGKFVYKFSLYNPNVLVEEHSGLSVPNININVTSYNGTYRWSVTACIDGSSDLCSTSESTVNIKHCDTTNPSKNQGIIEPKETQIVLRDTDNHDIKLSWPTPTWGTICYDKSMTRKMSLYINKKLKADFTAEAGEERKEWTYKDIKDGKYEWYIKSMTEFEDTRSSEVTTTNSSFSVCIFSIPQYEMKKKTRVDELWIIMGQREGLPIDIVKKGTLKICPGDRFEGELQYAMEYGISSSKPLYKSKIFANLTEGTGDDDVLVYLDYNENYMGPFTLRTMVKNKLRGITVPDQKVMEKTYKVCVPHYPPTMRIKITPNGTTGELKASWNDNDMNASGCNQGYMFDYNITYRSEVIKHEVTVNNFASIIGIQNGYYTINVSVYNGFFSKPASAMEYLCLKEDLGEMTLISPADGTSPWHENILFKYGKLADAKDSCMDVKYTLVLSDSEGGLRNIPLSVGSESKRLVEALKGDRTYYWKIERTTSQGAPETSPTYSFTPCDIKPEVKELQLNSPVEGANVTRKNNEPEFKWTLKTAHNECLLKWNFALYLSKNRDFSGAAPYNTDSDHFPIPRLEGNNNGGTTYWWKVSAANIESRVQSETSPRSFNYCECKSPGVPVPSYPKSTVFRASGGYFVSRVVDPGQSCVPENNETEPVSYEADIIQIEGGNFQVKYETEYNPSKMTYDDHGMNAIRIEPIPHDLPYGTYTWTVSAVNDADLRSTSESTSFVVCDYPSAVEILSPEAEAITNHTIVFKWSKETVFFGSPCNRKIRLDAHLKLYTERVNDTTNETEVILELPLSQTMNEWDLSETLLKTGKFNYSCHYRWYIITSNGEIETKSEEHDFFTKKLTCPFITCHNGGSCFMNASNKPECNCTDDYTGSNCQTPKGVNVGLIAGTTVGAFFIFAVIIGLIVFALIRKRRREARKRVTLKGPVKDLRFSNVKVPSEQESALSSDEMEKLRERLRDDAENGGFALSMAILGSAPSANIENASKALLYAHHHDHNDVMLMKALIRHEVSTSVKPDVIFRANTAATLTFKHMSKMVGLNYLFTTLGKVVRDVIQKDADDAAVEERMKNDKNLSELMVMQDTYEVDPTKLDDEEGGQDDLLSINSIQLTLLVQRFVKHIFQSADKMPAELHEVMSEVKKTVSSAYPEVVQNALSAFLFLRFFNCAIAVPESYGLLEEPPNERIRRSLVLATKVLTTMTSGAHFGEKEEFMTQFNEIIDKNQKELSAFYESVCNEVEGESSEFMDTPSDIYKNSMNVVAYYEKEAQGAAQVTEE